MLVITHNSPLSNLRVSPQRLYWRQGSLRRSRFTQPQRCNNTQRRVIWHRPTKAFSCDVFLKRLLAWESAGPMRSAARFKHKTIRINFMGLDSFKAYPDSLSTNSISIQKIQKVPSLTTIQGICWIGFEALSGAAFSDDFNIAFS